MSVPWRQIISSRSAGSSRKKNMKSTVCHDDGWQGEAMHPRGAPLLLIYNQLCVPSQAFDASPSTFSPHHRHHSCLIG
jgi:hypothetical protein